MTATTPSDDGGQQPISDEERGVLVRRCVDGDWLGDETRRQVLSLDARLTAVTEARRAVEKELADRIANHPNEADRINFAQWQHAQNECDDLRAKLADAEQADPETIADVQDAVRDHLIGWLERLGLESYIDGSGSDGGCVDLTESELSQATGRVDEMVGLLKDERDVAIRDREGCRGQNLVYHQEKLAAESREQAALAANGKLREALVAYRKATPQCECSEHSGCAMGAARALADRVLAANPEVPK